MKTIQMIGLQRSGTNYVEELIKLNFMNIHRIAGEKNFEDLNLHKHRIEPYTSNVPYFDNIDFVIFVYKNLYSWIESIAFRWSGYYEHVHRIFEPFEASEEELLLGPNKFNIVSLAKTYDLHITNWILKKYSWSDKIIVTPYEYLLSEQNVNNYLDKLTVTGLVRTSNITIPELGKVAHSESSYNPNHLDNYKSNKTLFLTNYQKEIAWSQLSTQVKDFLSENNYA